MFFTRLFDALASHRVEYLMIGGLAVSIHGVERATMDIDITIALTPENTKALIEVARALDFTPVLPVPLESLSDIEQLRQWHIERNLEAFALRTKELAGVTLDILLFPPLEFSDMFSRAVMVDVAGTQVRVAAIDDLIALKRAVGRPIDLSDIEHLERIKRL